MKLNFFEKALVNSRARAFAQRRYEAPLLERLGGRVAGGRVLEVACGRGVGTEISFERFGAARKPCVPPHDPADIASWPGKRKIRRPTPLQVTFVASTGAAPHLARQGSGGSSVCLRRSRGRT